MTRPDRQWFFPDGELARGPWRTVVDASIPGWQHTNLHVADLDTGDELQLTDLGAERIVIPLSGRCTVTRHADRAAAGEDVIPAVVPLAGRASVFDGPTDICYLPCTETATISGTGRVAVASAATDVVKPARYLKAADTPVELRGAGRCTRQVHNFGTPQALDAARLIVCEVITPAGNFSSYPPHKHDEHVPGRESRLEEIYYFQAGRADRRAAANRTAHDDAAFGMFATYTSNAGEIDVHAMVRSGDVALVPYGFHGPAAAAPGYDLYYLNVMAGPDPAREWLITDDPAYTWIRETWATEPVDPRLPFGPPPANDAKGIRP